MTHKIIAVVMLSLFAMASSAEAQLFPCLFRHREEVAQQQAPVLAPSFQQISETRHGVETLAEANEIVRKLSDDAELVDELCSFEDRYSELASVRRSQSISEVILRLNIASEVASMYDEALLARRFRIEAKLLSSVSKQGGSIHTAANIWLRNAERQLAEILKTKEPYKTLLEKFSPSYASDLQGTVWVDPLDFDNFKILAKEYTGQEFSKPIYWAAFKMIPLEDFHGTRKGFPPSAMFSTADRFALEKFVEDHSGTTDEADENEE